MARCYHDEQDFQSDLNIEVAREGDMLEYGDDLPGFKKCTKNPGHPGFIPFKDLTVEHLPQEERSIETLESIKRWGKCVVRLVVDKKRNGKLVKDAGSGFVIKNESGSEYWIKTNNHIVKNDDEVEHCTVEFFYDSHDSNVLISKGVKLVGTSLFRDLSYFTFDPVPEFLTQMDIKHPFLPTPSIVIYKDSQTVTCSSYLQRMSSQLVYYTSENLNNQQIGIMFISLDDNYISYLKSSYITFQPIPSELQIFNGIQIHIDEDDGNSKAISCDVIEYKDEFVVKISESIFQDKVKKYSLVWNGEVVSRGTRLYFQHVKSREFLSHMCEIDLEHYMETTSPIIWLFDFDPLPRGLVKYYKYMEKYALYCNMCCIGHPHGGIKMVTFGRCLEDSHERFDMQGRHIVLPDKDCKCTEVFCINYSCKTCPGSSGSAVFVLSKVLLICGFRSHFMGKSVKEVLPNGEQIENINMSW